MTSRSIGILACVLAGAAVTAQQGPGTATFDVASVKRSEFRPGDTFLANTGVAFPGGRWSALNTSVARMVRTLYNVQPEQIVGAPPWLDRDLFVIEARAADTAASREQVVEMAKALLHDRFKLRMHVETRPLDVHALVLARADGKVGSGLRPTACVPRSAETAGGAPPDPATPARRCGSWTRDIVDGLWRFRMNGFTLRTLVILHRVEDALGASVVDRTGLTGLFDVDIDYVPDPTARTSAGVPVLAALREQLGLKIERRREMTEMLVIDSVEHPAPD